MPLALTQQQKEDIFNQIRKAFSDFPYFDLLIKQPLLKMIDDSTQRDFGVETTKSLMKEYVDMSLYQNEQQKEALKIVEQILTASHVLLHSKGEFAQSLWWPDTNKLLSEYPEFSNVGSDVKELQYLLNFRNYMAVALTLLNASGNKIFLLRVIERLEGSGNEYITGSGQKASVTRRIEIYAKEGKVKSKKAGGRKPKDTQGPDVANSGLLTTEEPSAKKRKVNTSNTGNTAAPMNELIAAAITPQSAAFTILQPQDTDDLLGPAYADFDNAAPFENSDAAPELLLGLSKVVGTDSSFSTEREIQLNRIFSDGSVNNMTEEEAERLTNNA